MWWSQVTKMHAEAGFNGETFAIAVRYLFCLRILRFNCHQLKALLCNVSATPLWCKGLC